MPKQLSSFVAKLNSSLKLSEVQESGDYPVYGASGLVGYLNSYQTDVESVAIIKDGAGVGRTQIIPPKSSVLGTIQLLKPLPGIDAIYVKFLLDSMHLGNSFTGATIPHIYFRDYGQRIVPEHKPNQRRAISRSLSSITDGIAKARRQLSLLDEQVKSLFNEMFPQGKYSSRALISCCVDKDDVKCGPFGTQLSHDEYQTEGIPLYEIAQISSRFGKMPVNFLTVEKAKKLSQYSLLPGDIAMSRKGRVGDCVVVPQHFDEGIIHSDVVRIRSNPRILLSEFLACQFINSEKLQASVNQVSSGAIMPGINVTKLKNVEVECPPMGIQKEFVERLHQIDKLRFNYQKQIDLLNELMEKKMEEYFGGEEDA